MYKIFIVEDDKGIANGIKDTLLNWGFEIKICLDFQNVLGEFNEFNPHIVLLDIGLPFVGGFHWCSEIRKTSTVPIIIISSASDNMNMVMAMNIGADDFITKPFDRNVLIAKIQAILRRTYDFNISNTYLSYKGVTLQPDNSTLTYNDKKIELSKNENRILQCLLENKGKTVSREKLMNALWETDSFIDDNTLTVNVNRLRKKLEGIGLTDYISTKFGMGYILE